MKPRGAIEVFNKWIDCKDAYQADPSCDGRCHSCEYLTSAEEEREAMQIAISALEKQEQTNAQNVNSTHRSCPNALESLNILEQAKDDKGNVPMSLVRQAFRNVMEQDRWIPVTEKMPEEHKWIGTEHFKTTISDEVYVTIEVPSGERITEHMCFQNGSIPAFKQRSIDAFYKGGKVVAWKPLPEPYQEDKS